jgi:light-regulated signal transduction histidine kinase (bacteriophytochrome)
MKSTQKMLKMVNVKLKSKRTLRKMCRFLRNNNCDFSVEQNRHIKISVQNLDNAQTTFLVIAVSPSDVNFEKAFYKQASERLLSIGIRLNC